MASETIADRDDRQLVRTRRGRLKKITANVDAVLHAQIVESLEPGGALRERGLRDVTSVVEYGLRLAITRAG